MEDEGASPSNIIEFEPGRPTHSSMPNPPIETGQTYEILDRPTLVGSSATRWAVIGEYLRGAQVAIGEQRAIIERATAYRRHPLLPLLAARDAAAELRHASQGIAYQLLEVPLAGLGQLEYKAREFGRSLWFGSTNAATDPSGVVRLPIAIKPEQRSSWLEALWRRQDARWLMLALGAAALAGSAAMLWQRAQRN